ncbi:hypothetical protein WA026_015152 [Henosepilachna vigintioctopunctata]|uniref:Uncharacterized protein n=1 Tax=Henosepilachna vigintioctopunctata TaxID=420089 RepID=A0AAW1TT98_9CUCU
MRDQFKFESFWGRYMKKEGLSPRLTSRCDPALCPHKLMYGVTTLIGCYSGKVIDSVVESDFCADEFQVVRSECIGHVQNRMGTRLRKTKIDNHLGGRGKLTEALIKK